jgi:hypothetical protein
LWSKLKIMKKVLLVLFLIICLLNDSYSQKVIEETYIVKGKVISKKKYDRLLYNAIVNHRKNYFKNCNKIK